MDSDFDSNSSRSCPSSKTSERKYEVFLSFRGEDTRDNFISHLYKDLCQHKGIETFIDNNDLQKGHKISESLLKAIEDSKIAIIVFSKHYASSTWCLDELGKIIDCQESRGLFVLPVFYHVDPSNVRKQSGSFGEAFERHEERFKYELEKVQRWRSALTKAADLSGFDSEKIKPESALVDKIVNKVLQRLNHTSTSENKGLVGLNWSIKKIESLLWIESKEVFAVGIWGMGGIGKTTLACAIFNRIKGEFDAASFQRNVREGSKSGRLLSMRKEFLCEVLKDEHATLESTSTINRLHRKRILVVLDDVTIFTQMEELIGNFEQFGSGSRIIVTSRDKQVLSNCGVKDNKIYEVKGLQKDKALQLFSRYAFKEENPQKDFMELSTRTVNFVKGVPLALKIFGSRLYQKSKSEWESLVPYIESREILDVLKLSYDELNDDEKNVFLDIACFLNNVREKYVMKILKTSESIINSLVEKSLISIPYIGFGKIISMHDLLEELGKKIVKEGSKDPGKRSRLWHLKDINHVLTCNTGKGSIEAICLDISNIPNILQIHHFAFSNMHDLRILDIFPSSKMSLSSDPNGTLSSASPGEESKNKVAVDQGLDFFCTELRYLVWYGYQFRSLPSNANELWKLRLIKPHSNIEQLENKNKVAVDQRLDFVCTELRYLRWWRYQLKSLPSNFNPRNLVVLIMPHSNIEQLGNGFQRFDNLKKIDLRHSKNLTSIRCLSSNLESLILKGCSSLIEIDPSHGQYRNKLVELDLTDCKKLESLPAKLLQSSETLEYVFLSGCSNLRVAPKITSSMKEVLLDGTAIEEFPLVEDSSSLHSLSLHNCSMLKSLPSAICKSSKCLSYLNLSGCSKLKRLPDDLEHMKFLWEIKASYTAIREVPSSIVNCNQLRALHLQGCKGGQELVHSAWPLLSCLKFLYYLDLSDCQITHLPDNLGQLSSLRTLFLSQNKFQFIPRTIKDLIELRLLFVNDCTSLLSLPELPRGVEVQAYNCKSLQALPYFSLKQKFNLANCCKLVEPFLNAQVGPFFNGQVEAALLEFQLDRPDFKIQVINALLDNHISRQSSCVYFAHVCYPGNEIPEFFNFKSMGSSVTIELPLGNLKQIRWSDLLGGRMLCVVVTFRDPHTIGQSLTIRSRFTAESKDGKTRKEHSDNIDCLRSWVDPSWLGNFKGLNMTSDHVILWCSHCPNDPAVKWESREGGIYKVECFYERVTFNFDIIDCENIQVKECGVKLLYPTDEEET